MGSCFSTNGASSSNAQTNPLISSLESKKNQQIHQVTTEQQFNEIINAENHSQRLIVCDFYAIWCPPCSQIATVIDEWARSNYYQSNVLFVKIDVDQTNELSERFSIRVLPTFIFFKNGQEVTRLNGVDSSGLKNEIEKFK